MAIFLKEALGPRMVHVFIEAPLELRVEREWRKLGGERWETVASRVREKDVMKQHLGVPQLLPLADVVLDNSGSLRDYRNQLDRLLDEHPPIVNQPPEVSSLSG
jgi:dephospho-CoA kinase